MGNITFGGLASGLDTNSIITALGNAERAPITSMQTKQKELRTQLSTLSTVMSRLSSLKTAAENLDTMGELLSFAASSSNATRVGVSASSSATPGTYALSEVTLATNQKSLSKAFDAKTSTVGTGTLKVTQGGKTFDLTIDSGNNTLEGVAAAINGASGLDVNAAIFYDGSKYRILATSGSMGADAAFSVDDSGLSGGSTLELGVGDNTIQAAVNGSFKLDGQLVVTKSNTVTDVLPGVTLNLNQAFSDAPVAITVATDTSAIVSKVHALADMYNSAMAYIKTQFTYNGNGGQQTNTPLFGDSTLRSAQLAISSVVSAPLAGHAAGSSALADFGASVDRSGTLVIDDTKLRARLTEDPTSLGKFFEGYGSVKGFGATLAAAIDQYTDPSKGMLDAKQDAINSRISDFDNRISAADKRASAYEANLRKQFTALERVMSQLQSQQTFLTQQFK